MEEQEHQGGESEAGEAGEVGNDTQGQTASTPRRRGKDRTSRKFTAAGLGSGRPAGKQGSIPEGVDEPTDADLVWMNVKDEIEAEGLSPHDMEIRVKRLEPPPSMPVGTIDCGAIKGDHMTSPGVALRNFMIDYVHLQSQVQGPANFEMWFVWKNKSGGGGMYKRAELRLPSRQECIQMRAAEALRTGSGNGAGPTLGPGYIPPGVGREAVAPAPPLPAPGFAPAGVGAQPQFASPGYAAPAVPAAFDLGAEREKIRAELQRDMEVERMRGELDQLRRERDSGRRNPPSMGFGRYPGRDERPETEEIARVVVATLTSMGIAPQRGLGAPPAYGQPPPPLPAPRTEPMDDLERAFKMFERFSDMTKRARGVLVGEEESRHPPHVEPEPEPEIPAMRFQEIEGQRWRDGRPVMMSIGRDGSPKLPSTIPEAIALGFANPFLMEPFAEALGPAVGKLASRFAGFGAAPAQQPQRGDIHVQQTPYQQPQLQHPEVQQQTPSPPSPAAAAAPPPPPPPPPTGEWNLG